MTFEPTADSEDVTPGLGPVHKLQGAPDDEDQLIGEGTSAPLVISRTVDAEALNLAREVVGAASDKGATDIVLMDIRKLSIVADYFVICTGDNERQLRAIARAILAPGQPGVLGTISVAGPSFRFPAERYPLLDAELAKAASQIAKILPRHAPGPLSKVHRK